MLQTVFKEKISEEVRDKIRDLFYKRQGLKALIESSTEPTEQAIIKLGKATSDWEQYGNDLAQTIGSKLVQEGKVAEGTPIKQWTCDFENCEMEITLE